MRAFHAVDDPAHCIRRLNRERLSIPARGNEREHHHIGIAIEEHVFDEFLGSEAVKIAPRAWLGGKSAARLGRPFESVVWRRLHPRAGWVNEVPLHVKDKLALATDPCLGELRFERRFGLDLEETAALPCCGIGGIYRQQRARRAARRNQEITPADAQTLCILARRRVRQLIAGVVGRRKRHRRELSVRSRVYFYRQPPALGINHAFHKNEYRSGDYGDE